MKPARDVDRAVEWIKQIIMQEFLEQIIYGDINASMGGPETGLLMLLLSFCLGHVVGWVYMWTHTGLSYSRMFVASLVILPVIVSVLMMLMQGNVLVAIGLLAVFSVVRFRNVLKDTRDTSFILWTIVMGMAVGTLHFSTALLGCLFLSVIFIYLHTTNFGTRLRYDSVLNLRLTGDLVKGVNTLKKVLYRHSARTQLASERNLTDAGLELSYRILLRDPKRGHELVSELRETGCVSDPSLFNHNDEAEF
jgi:hypothetical protein